MAVPTRRLGRNGPLVPAIAFGAMSIGSGYGQENTVDEKIKLLDHAWKIGERFWDTSDVYQDSEDRIAEWFKQSGKRSDIFLATKGGLAYSFEPTGLVETARSDPEYIRSACEKSLKKLGIETIDLYYCHRIDCKTPIEKTIEAMVELKNEGKIRYLGLSEVSASTIRRAYAVYPIEAVQVEYSLFTRDIESPENQVLETCRELGIAVVAYSPVGRGMLTGRWVKDTHLFFQATPKYSGENIPRIAGLVTKIEAVAKRRGCKVAQVCLAWLLAQGEEIIPIPGTRTLQYLEENTAAANVKLTEADVKELRQHAEEAGFVGDRYPKPLMSKLFGDTPPL